MYVEYRNKFKNYNRMYQEVFEHPGNEVEVAQDMLNGSLDQGSLMCLGYAYFISIPEPEYAYKHCSYKEKKHVSWNTRERNVKYRKASN